VRGKRRIKVSEHFAREGKPLDNQLSPMQGGAEGDNWETKKIKSAVSCSWDLKLTKLFLPVQFIK